MVGQGTSAAEQLLDDALPSVELGEQGLARGQERADLLVTVGQDSSDAGGPVEQNSEAFVVSGEDSGDLGDSLQGRPD